MLSQSTYTVDSERCAGCGRCARVCFFGNFEVDGGKARVAEGGHCLDCGHCYAVCAVGAVVRRDGEAAGVERFDGQRMSYEQLMGLLSMRRSRREFKKEAVPADVIEKLIRAATQGPSALNKRQTQYTVITDPDVISQLSGRSVVSMQRIAGMVRNWASGFFMRLAFGGVYREMLDLLPEIDGLAEAHKSGEDRVLYNAPCVILVHTPKTDVCGPENAIYCAANILLAAETLGLGACVIGFVTGPMRNDPEMKRLVRLPEGHYVHTTIALGYPEFGYAGPAPKSEPTINLVK